MTVQRLEWTLFRAVPALTLVVAYAGLCAMTGTIWPWNQVVHEDGTRTLLATVFFVEHGARELLPDALLALGVAGAVRYFFPSGPVAASAVSSAQRRFGLVVILVVMGVVGGTLWAYGGQALGDNLLQLHTRAGAPLVWGAHWRYHLIERFAQIMLAFSVAGAVWHLRGRPGAGRPRSVRMFVLAIAALVILTIVFRPTAEPFRDPAFLGHQLRELFTHSLVTLPLALGTCLGLASHSAAPGAQVSGGVDARPDGLIVASGAAAVISGAFLLMASLMADAQSHGQAEGLAALLFPHFAEHAIGYVFVPALAGLLYLRKL